MRSLFQRYLDGVIFKWSWRFGGGVMTNSPWKYFKAEEVEGLESEFVAKLEKARHIAGVPFIITSGKRSEVDNATVGGVQDSAHLSGRGVDLRSRDSHTHFKIVEGAILAGIRRIGVYRNQEGSPSHIHLDDDASLPQEVLWLGVSR